MTRHLQAGSTVVEVLVALTLLAALALMSARAFLTLITVTAQSGTLTVASALAASKLEEIRARVEAKPDRASWRASFCSGIVAEPVTGFPAPYADYSYRVLIDENAVAARPGEDDLLLPCWGIDWAVPGRCPGPQYAPACAGDERLIHEERLRWVTVEVFFREGTRAAARVTSAIVRGAYHR